MPSPLLLCLAALLPPAAPAVDDTPSLQAFLIRLRAERRAVQARLAVEVEAALADLDSVPKRAAGRELERRRKRLVALGGEVAPLLVEYLEPGEGDTRVAVQRAALAVDVLRELRSVAITDRLLELTRTGTGAGRTYALAVLETTPEPARVAPAVRELFEVGEGELREAALLTLARMGGPEASQLLATALADDDDAIVDLAIRSLASEQGGSVATGVRELAQGSRGPSHVPALIDFYTARRELLAEREHSQVLLELAVNEEVPREQRIALLSRLAELEVDLDRNGRKILKPLSENVNDELREAALVLLAQAGDKTARGLLLKRYNEAVSRQEDYDAVYTERARIYYRIGDYAKGIKDYREAIKLQNARRRTSPRASEPYIGIARCYARLRRFKDAAEYLDKAPVSITTLRELASDPAFAEMRKTRWVSAFHLDE